MNEQSYKLRQEKERTKQVAIQEISSMLKSPLFQAFIVWTAVEALQRFYQFGSVSGSILEGASVGRIFDIEKTLADVTKVSESLAPVLTMLTTKGAA